MSPRVGIGTGAIRRRAIAAGGVLVALTFLALTSWAGAAARFSAPVLVRTGPGAETLFSSDLSLHAADVNQDGRPDLVAATYRGVTVLYGNGDGSFHRRTYRVRDPVDVAVGDVSGDGRPDLIAVRSSEDDGFVVVFDNDGAERFHRAGVYTLENDSAISVAAGDFSGDGVSDVVVEELNGDFVMLLAAGDGRLAAPRLVPGPAGCGPVVGDFNSDGRLDVAIGRYTRSVRVRLGNGDGSFAPALAFRNVRGGCIDSTTDLNDDGALDLVVTRYPAFFDVLLGRNDGTFVVDGSYRMGTGGYPAGASLVGDFDGDQVADVAAARYGHPIQLRLGVGAGRFGQRRALPRFSDFTYAVEEYEGTGAVADFNGDGRLDIAIVGRTTPPEFSEPAVWDEPAWVAVLLNQTGLQAPPCVVVPVTHEVLRVAKRHLTNAGCRLGRVRYRYSRRIRAGRVISQRPSYGVIRPSRTRVDLVVSRESRHDFQASGVDQVDQLVLERIPHELRARRQAGLLLDVRAV